MDRVVIGARGDLRFRAVRILAHGDTCEPLHGADFCVQVTLQGDLGTTGRMIDFHTVTLVVHRFCMSVHRRILLPLDNPTLTVRQDGEVWHATHGMRRWTFPTCDVAVFRVVNLTNEMLARLCLAEVRGALQDDVEAGVLRDIEVAVSDPEGTASYDEAWAVPSGHAGARGINAAVE